VTGDTLFVFMEDRPLKSRVLRPGQGNIRETIGCLGLLCNGPQKLDTNKAFS